LQANYAKGALGYVGSGLGNFSVWNGQTVALAWTVDAVYDSGNIGGSLSGLELTEGWSIAGGYQHNWNAQWKTSLYGGYLEVNYGDLATRLFNTLVYSNATTQTTFSPDVSFWQAGSRTVWTPTRGLDLSVDVMYHHVDVAADGATFAMAAGNGKSSGTYTIADQDIWSGIFRVQRNFYP
jgi:hypothetical protein